MFATKEIAKQLLIEKKICKIVFLGDSITSAEWIHPNFREIIEYVLKEHFAQILSDWKTPSWNIRCHNAGFDGSATRDITELLDNYVLKLEPNILLYQLGSNDNYIGISDEEYLNNLKNTVTKLVTTRTHLLLMSDLPSGYQEHNERYQPRKKLLEQVVKEFQLPYLDLYTYFGSTDLNEFYSLISNGNEEAGIKRGEVDKIHPNVIGNVHLAKAILATFWGIPFDEKKYLEDLDDTSIFYPRF